MPTLKTIIHYAVLVIGACAFLWILWWQDDWVAGLFGALAMLCVAAMLLGYLMWRHELEVHEDMQAKLKAHRDTTRSYIQRVLDKKDEQMHAILIAAEERRQDSRLIILDVLKLYDGALDENERLGEEARQGRLFIGARRFRDRLTGRFTRPPPQAIEAQPEPIVLPPPPDIEAI